VPASAWLIAILSAGCFALALVLTQFGLRTVAAWRGATVSIPSSMLLFWIAAPVVGLGGWSPEGAAIFAAIGLLFPAAVTLLTFAANRHMGPGTAGALGNLAPLVAVGVALAWLGETPGPTQLAGIAVIVAGVTVLSLRGRALAGDWPLWVLALPFAAAAIRGLVQPVVKVGLAAWPSPFAAALIGYTVSSAVMLGLAVSRGGALAPMDRRGAAWFALVGLANGTAVLTMYAALAMGPVTLVAPVIAVYPAITLAIGAMLLRAHPITRRQLTGVALTVAGVIVLLSGCTEAQ